jgi:hypothetical protein
MCINTSGLLLTAGLVLGVGVTLGGGLSGCGVSTSTGEGTTPTEAISASTHPQITTSTTGRTITSTVEFSPTAYSSDPLVWLTHGDAPMAGIEVLEASRHYSSAACYTAAGSPAHLTWFLPAALAAYCALSADEMIPSAVVPSSG